MKRSLKENFEEIQLLSFDQIKNEEKAFDTEISTLTIVVPYNGSQFAISAMLKGYYDNFLSVTGHTEEFSPEILEKIEHNLKMFSESIGKPKEESPLILP